MAITVGGTGAATTSGTGTATVSLALANASGANRVVVVGARLQQTAGTPSFNTPTLNGVSMTLLRQTEDSFGGNDVGLWYMLDANLPAAAGSYDVVITTNVATVNLDLLAVELAGAAQAAPEAQNDVYTNAAADGQSVSITTLTDGAWVIDVGGCLENRTINVGAGQTLRASNAGAPNTYMSTKEVATAGATTMSFSGTTDGTHRTIVVASFAPAGGGAATSKPYYHRLSAFGGLGSGL